TRSCREEQFVRGHVRHRADDRVHTLAWDQPSQAEDTWTFPAGCLGPLGGEAVHVHPTGHDRHPFRPNTPGEELLPFLLRGGHHQGAGPRHEPLHPFTLGWTGVGLTLEMSLGRP